MQPVLLCDNTLPPITTRGRRVAARVGMTTKRGCYQNCIRKFCAPPLLLYFGAVLVINWWIRLVTNNQKMLCTRSIIAHLKVGGITLRRCRSTALLHALLYGKICLWISLHYSAPGPLRESTGSRYGQTAILLLLHVLLCGQTTLRINVYYSTSGARC